MVIGLHSSASFLVDAQDFIAVCETNRGTSTAVWWSKVKTPQHDYLEIKLRWKTPHESKHLDNDEAKVHSRKLSPSSSRFGTKTAELWTQNHAYHEIYWTFCANFLFLMRNTNNHLALISIISSTFLTQALKIYDLFSFGFN